MLLHTAVFGLLAAASAPPQAPVDTTIPVAAGAQLRLDASAGRVTLRAWDENAVRVVVTPLAGTSVRIETTGALVRVIGAAGTRIDEASYVLTVPRRMTVALEASDAAIDIVGVEGDVTARNHSGAISARDAKGQLALKSTLGEIVVTGCVCRVSAQALSGAIRLTDITGDVTAEGAAQHIHLTRVTSRSLRASTVSGVVWFSGPFVAGGRYAFSSHGGAIWLTVSEPVNATLLVGTVSGAFSSGYSFTREDGPRRGRFTVKVGTGSAMVDVETFSGAIVLRKPDS